MSEQKILSKCELNTVTGYQQPAAQLRWLRRQGIQAYRNGAGQIVATWHSVNYPAVRATSENEPNFEALEFN